MKNEIQFAEAFKDQLEIVKPLTEATLAAQGLKYCELSNEPLKLGDTLLWVGIVESNIGDETFVHIAAVKKEVLEAKQWTYYPSIVGKVPIAIPEFSLKKG